MPYKHTQFGRMIIITSSLVLLYLGMITSEIRADTEARMHMLIAIGIVAFTMFSFATLTVSIDEMYLRIKFGYGIFQKKIAVQNIASAKIVKNKRYYGRGIKMRLRPYMWIYNVSGLDAVEITTKNNRTYRIGTDEPEILEQTILQKIK